MPNSSRPRRRRRGFALPLAILALALMTATIIAAYSSTSAESVANNSMRAQERALQLAQTGLQQFLVRRSEAGFFSGVTSGWATGGVVTLSQYATDPSTADSEWTRVTLPGGYADVVAMRQRSRFSSLGIAAVYFMRSTGVDTSVMLSGAGNAVYAKRTIGQYATWGTTPVKVMGGITSLNGLRNNNTGGASRIDGTDDCSTDPDVAGAVVPKGGTYGGTGPAPAGTPAVDSSMTLDSIRKVVGIDWNGILNSNLIPADYTIPGSTFPTTTWFNANTTAWPVFRIKTNNYSIPSDGRGIIIADSNIVFPTGSDWDGVVLIGGIARATGTGAIDGVLVTGLNKLLPNHPNPYDFSVKDTVNTTKRVRYSSCNVEDSADKLKIYFAMMNTLMDNVAIW